MPGLQVEGAARRRDLLRTGLSQSVIRNQHLVAAITLMAVSGVLFAVGLDAHEIGRDEAVSVLLARRPLAQELQLLANHEPNPAGHFLLLHFWPHATALQARLLSYFPALLIPPVVFAIARQLSLPAWTAGLLAATSPFLAYHAAEARAYAWLALAGALALSLTIKVLNPEPSAQVLSVLLGASLAAGLYFHYFAAFTVIAALGALLLYRQYAKLAAVFATVVVLFLPGALMLIHQVVVFRQNLAGGWQTRIGPDGVVETLGVLFAGAPDYPPGLAVAAGFGVCMLLVLRRIGSREVQLLLLFAACGFVAPLFLGMLVPFLTPRYLAATVPVLILLVATGVRTLSPRVAGLATVFLTLASAGLIVQATTRIDGQKVQIKEGLALARAERALPVVHGYLFATPAAFYAPEEVAFSYEPPPVDYYGLYALPAGAEYPPGDRRPVLFFDYCDQPPVALDAYTPVWRKAYPGRLCYDLERTTSSRLAAAAMPAARTYQQALGSAGAAWPQAF